MEILRDFVAYVLSNYRASDIPCEFPRGIPIISRRPSKHRGSGVNFGNGGGSNGGGQRCGGSMTQETVISVVLRSGEELSESPTNTPYPQSEIIAR